MTTLSQLTIVLVLLAAAPAWAQTPRADGPFAGLFGGRGGSEQVLDVRGSLSGAYQHTKFPEGTDLDLLDPRFRESSAYESASAALSYQFTRSGDESSFFVGGRGSISQFSLIDDIYPYNASGNFGVSSRLTRRTRFSASGDASYSPYYGFPGLDAGFSPETGFGIDPSLVGQNFGFAALDQPNIVFGGQVGITAELTRRTTLSGDADYREHRLIDSDVAGTLMYGGRVTLRRQISRDLGIRLGYGRQFLESQLDDNDPLLAHVIDVGVDYAGNFSLGRRTTVTLGSSTSMLRMNDESHFRVNGAAGLTHGIGRSWQLSAGYDRNVEVLPGFVEPLLTDRFTTAVGGLLAPRVAWSAMAGWNRGELGFDAAEAFVTYSGTIGLQLALLSHLALYTQYGYFFYELPSGSATLGFLREFSRHSASVGVTTYLPIFSTGRRPRDSR